MNDQGNFAGQVVLVTGGSRGIGYATAAAFLDQGARVAICAVDEGRLGDAITTLAEHGEVVGWPADVGKYPEVEKLVQRTLNRFGGIDILVNNAGRIAVSDLAEQAPESIDMVIDTNLKGPLYVSHAVLPHMLKRGRGRIINISSSLGTFGMPRVAAYCASKFGLVGFTEALAEEVKGAGIDVYGMTLSMCATDMQAQLSGYRQGMPPEIVAEEILLLAGPNPPIKSGACLSTYV